MKQIQITPAELRTQAAELNSLRAEYESLFSNLNSVLNRTNDAWSENLSHNFVGKISSTQKSCSSILEALQWGSTAATKSAESFETIDNTLANGLNGNAASDGGSSAGGSDGGGFRGGETKSMNSTVLSLLGKMGFAGSLLAGDLKLLESFGKATSDWNAKNVTSLLKNAQSTVKGISEFFEDAGKLEKYSHLTAKGAVTTGLKRFLGLNKYMKNASKASSFSTKFYNNFQKLKSGGPFKNFTKGGATSAFAWIGTGLSAVANGITNFDAYKAGKIDKIHAIANTVVSTGVDVVKNWAIGVGVAAAVVAIAPGATAVAVGAATVAATVAIDAGCKWVTKTITKKTTGKDSDGLDSTQLITKAIVGVGDCAVGLGKKAVQGLKDLVPKIKLPGANTGAIPAPAV